MKSNFLLTKLMLLLCLLVGSVNGAWAAGWVWQITAPADLQTGDIVVIVDQTSSSAMPNDKGTSSAPSATKVTLNDEKSEITSDVASTLQWEVTVDNGSYKFNVPEGTKYLYCTGSNNGVRVGTNANNAFTIEKDGEDVDFLKNTATSRYLGVYNNQDWRCYTSINANIKDCVTAFYKRTADVSDSRTETTVTIDASGITNTNVFTGTAAGSLSAIVKAGEAAIGSATVTWKSETESVATITSGGTVTLVGAGTTQITASFEGDATYKPSTATYTLTVTNYDPNAPGTINNPYTVAEVINGTATGTGIYVKGFIVGCYKNNSFTNSDLDVTTNLALADNADETTNVIPVELPKGDRRTAFNVEAHPYNVGVAQILYKGNAEAYFGENGLKGAQVGTEKIAEKIDITAAGMATYYTDCALDFTGLTDMYAYIVTKDGDSNYSLTRVNKVPAKTGLLLYNPNGGVASNVVPVLTEGAENVDGSILTGTLEKTTAGTNDYILNNGAEGVGFYKGNGQDIDMHRAYLTVAASARPFFLINFDSEATGISFVGREASMNNRFFNLKGQQVKTPQKGLYIVNGKKVIVK